MFISVLKQVEKLEAEIGKFKKNAEDLGTTLRTKCNEFFNRLDEIEVNEELCEDVDPPKSPKVVVVVGVFCHLKS